MFKSIALLALAAIPSVADVQIRSSYNTDGQSAETTIWSNGNRMRYDYGNGVVTLRYCDQQKMVQLDEKGKSFLTLPTQEAAKTAGSKPEVTDTGEHKELFGFPARHLKIVDSVEGKDGKMERSETDGWYLDLRALGPCFGAAGGVGDRGYPASYTIESFGENGKPTSRVTMQVVSITSTPIASAMFDVPADYKDSTPRAIPKGGSPKAAGAIRIGALPVRDRAMPAGRNDALSHRLATQLMDAKLDFVQLDDGPQESIDRRAKETSCDLVLYTEVTSVEKPATGKVGGLLHKAPGLSHVTGGDGMEAHVEYRLTPQAGGAPLLASTAVAKAGTSFDLKGAALLASNFVPMAMAARMMSGALNPAMMTALASGRSFGASMATVDPMMGGLTTMLRMTMPAQGPQANGGRTPTALEAVAAAIDQEGKAIIAQMNAAAK